MKTKNILLIASLGLFLSCSSTPETESVHISGLLKGLPEGEVEMNFFRDHINNDRKIISLELDEQGGFAKSFPLDRPVLATISTSRGNIPIFLEPGYGLHMEAKAAALPHEIRFSGLGSEENKLLAGYRLEPVARLSRATINEQAARLSPEDFATWADSIKAAKMDFYHSHTLEQELSEAFRWHFETQALTEKYRMLFSYPAIHQQLNEVESPAGLPREAKLLAYDENFLDARRLLNLDYVNFLLSWFDHLKSTGDYGFDKDESRHLHNYQLADKYLEGRLKYYIQALSVSREMNSGDMELAMDLYHDFLTHNTQEDFTSSLQDALERIQSLWAGNEAPPFTMTDIRGREVSLSDYRGKVVVLKFWASWCGPCMRQVPPAAELKERLAGEEDLVFIYVSIDTSEEAWRRAVEDHNITGLHMRTPGRERGTPALYNVRWIPTFYIIGRDGKIFDHRPPMPADPQIDQVLLNALRLS